MKKLIALAMIAGSIGVSSITAEAKTSEPTAVQTMQRMGRQQTVQTQVRRNGRVVRTVTSTRRVRVGRQVYRETIQTTYRPNGRTTTRVISRVRVR